MKQLFYFIFGVFTTLMILLMCLKEDGSLLPPILCDTAFDWFWNKPGIPIRATITIGSVICTMLWLFLLGKGTNNEPPRNTTLEGLKIV